MSPSVVADLVIKGITDNARYIITHPEQWSAVERRMKAIEAAFHAADIV